MEIKKSSIKEIDVEQLISEATKLRNELELLEERIINCINGNLDIDTWNSASGCNDDIH